MIIDVPGNENGSPRNGFTEVGNAGEKEAQAVDPFPFAITLTSKYNITNIPNRLFTVPRFINLFDRRGTVRHT